MKNSVIDVRELGLWRADLANAARFFSKADAPTALAAWNDSEVIQLVGTSV